MYLELKGVCKSYGGSAVLKDVSFGLEKGRSLAVVAPSGAGKSTLLSVAGLLLSPDAGSVLVGGRDVAALDDDARSLVRGCRVGFLFQHTQLVGTLRAWENVAVAADFARGARALDVGHGARASSVSASGDARDAHGAGLFADAEAVKRRSIELLESLGLADRVHHFPHQLSVGQKRRIATARALVNEPELIIADEPTNDLDRANAERVVDALFARVEAGESALLFATHDADVAARADARYDLTLPGGGLA